MHSYQPPLRDMRFVIEELWPELNCPPETAIATLELAGRFSRDVLAPLNLLGDRHGCVFQDGTVKAPAGFQEAYRVFAEAGLPALACEERHGGTGLPHGLRVLVEEMITGANLAFASYTNLIHGAYVVLSVSAGKTLKARFLPELVSGRSAATMCLTEADSGSDLSRIQTVAEPIEGQRYRITGTKIFVSAGEHDLTQNIIHLVLARLPDAPAGTRGISMFLAPKMIEESGATRRNQIRCQSIERKMGQNGSATCVLEFDGAEGWLVGAPHSGLPAMFSMMNTVRMGAALQGLGVSEAAYQCAVNYALIRQQGRHIDGPRHPELAADPIIVHPDIRRMLLTMRTHVEGMRALIQWVAQALDEGERDPDFETRKAANDRVALMTPVIKALFTDLGSECANTAVQVLGGHGYIRGNAAEQYVRDVRVAQIYDGTNGIQALDLVFRKVLRLHLAGILNAAIDDLLEGGSGNEFTGRLRWAGEQFATATNEIEARAENGSEVNAAVAYDYLRLAGWTALTLVWARAGNIAARSVDGPDGEFYRAKLATARFFFARMLPEVGRFAELVMNEGEAVLDFDINAFARD